MQEIKATPRNAFLGLLGDAFTSAQESMGLLGDAAFGSLPKMLEDWSYGTPPIQFGSTDNGLAGALYGMKVNPGVVDGLGLLGSVPGASKFAAREAARAINDAMMGGGNALVRALISPVRPSNMLISSQRFLDPDIVAQKLASHDFGVLVSPEFNLPDLVNEPLEVLLDGHHSYAAARQAGVQPDFTVATPQVHDAVTFLENGDIDGFLNAVHQGDDYFDVNTGKFAW